MPPIRLPAARPRCPLRCGRDGDRELRQAARDREQQQPAELLAEAKAASRASVAFESAIAGDPGRRGRSREHPDEQRRCEPRHRRNYRRGVGWLTNARR